MRIQNEQDLAESFPEFPLADISSLFMNQSADKYEYMTRKKIDSMTLGETEYDSLLEEHFERDIPDGKDNLHLCHVSISFREVLSCKHI